MDCLELFLDAQILQWICDQSNLYAAQKNQLKFHLTIPSLRRFLGILVLTGYHTVPSLKHYWSLDEDKGVPIVRRAMSRNHFVCIKKFLHLANNDTLDKTDKFAKVRPLFNLLNEKFAQFGVFSKCLSIDEQMVPYFGRHSAKMYIRGKPVRFGFKLWCLASSNGYLYAFIPYAGASAANDGLGLGERVVLNLLEVVERPSEHLVFFDNFFSSYKLMCKLVDQGFKATGTVRANRVGGADAILGSVKSFSRLPKGAYTYAKTKHGDATITLSRWKDNSVVTLISNYDGCQPLGTAKRFNRLQRTHEHVPQPHVVGEYNRSMGGVDLHDNAIANYRIGVRGKKWWWPLFVNSIDSVVVNAWKFHNVVSATKISQFEFRSTVAMALMASEEPETEDHQDQENTPSNSLGRPSKLSYAATVRLDGRGHTTIRCNRRRRCRQCSSQTVYGCQKCGVPLHSKCSRVYHAPTK